jgi:hypothetical protein
VLSSSSRPFPSSPSPIARGQTYATLPSAESFEVQAPRKSEVIKLDASDATLDFLRDIPFERYVRDYVLYAAIKVCR